MKETHVFVEEKKITTGHAKILVGLDNAYFIANKIIEKKLSVRQSENFVKILEGCLDSRSEQPLSRCAKKADYEPVSVVDGLLDGLEFFLHEAFLLLQMLASLLHSNVE